MPPTSQDLIRRICRVTFPSVKDLVQRYITNFHQHMHVIRHDHPRQQSVVFAVVVPEVLLHQLRYAGLSQVTCAVSQVKVTLKLSLSFEIVIEGHQCLPFITTTAWKGIGEAVSEILAFVRKIEMGQVL